MLARGAGVLPCPPEAQRILNEYKKLNHSNYRTRTATIMMLARKHKMSCEDIRQIVGVPKYGNVGKRIEREFNERQESIVEFQEVRQTILRRLRKANR